MRNLRAPDNWVIGEISKDITAMPLGTSVSVLFEIVDKPNAVSLSAPLYRLLVTPTFANDASVSGQQPYFRTEISERSIQGAIVEAYWDQRLCHGRWDSA